MAPYNIAIALIILAASSTQASSFDVQRHDGHRLRIRLGEDEALILPRRYAVVRNPALGKPPRTPLLPPAPLLQPPPGDKFRPDPRFKKPLKYFIKQNNVVKVKQLPPGLLLDPHQRLPHSDPGAAGGDWLLSGGSKGGSSGGGVGVEQELGFDELFQPVSLVSRPGGHTGSGGGGSGGGLGDGGLYADDDLGVTGEGHRGHFDDLKPVTENIDDDLKYDFRTKTHTL